MNHSFSLGFTTSAVTALNATNATTDNDDDEDDKYYRWNFAFSVILATLLSISAFLAVVGNSMVLTVVIRHRGMRTRTNLFLVNLAVADLLVGAAVMPLTITTLIEGRWIFGSGTFCTINGWLNCFCLVASIHTLMYISVHKHYSITQPMASHFKLRQILGMMAAAWVWAAVSSTITVTGLSSVRYKRGTTQCGPEYPDGLKSYIFHAIIQVSELSPVPFRVAACFLLFGVHAVQVSDKMRDLVTVEGIKYLKICVLNVWYLVEFQEMKYSRNLCILLNYYRLLIAISRCAITTSTRCWLPPLYSFLLAVLHDFLM